MNPFHNRISLVDQYSQSRTVLSQMRITNVPWFLLVIVYIAENRVTSWKCFLWYIIKLSDFFSLIWTWWKSRIALMQQNWWLLSIKSGVKVIVTNTECVGLISYPLFFFFLSHRFPSLTEDWTIMQIFY